MNVIPLYMNPLYSCTHRTWCSKLECHTFEHMHHDSPRDFHYLCSEGQHQERVCHRKDYNRVLNSDLGGKCQTSLWTSERNPIWRDYHIETNQTEILRHAQCIARGTNEHRKGLVNLYHRFRLEIEMRIWNRTAFKSNEKPMAKIWGIPNVMGMV